MKTTFLKNEANIGNQKKQPLRGVFFRAIWKSRHLHLGISIGIGIGIGIGTAKILSLS